MTAVRTQIIVSALLVAALGCDADVEEVAEPAGVSAELGAAGAASEASDIGLEWTPNCNEKVGRDLMIALHAQFGMTLTCAHAPGSSTKTFLCQVTNQGNRRVEGDVVKRGSSYSHIWWYRLTSSNTWEPIYATNFCVCGQSCEVREPPFQ